MNVLLFILKIIGILLLILLTIILILLFHPLFYKVTGECEEEISIHGHIWWVFRILRLEFQLEEKTFHYSLRIFGKKIFSDNTLEEINEAEDMEIDSPIEEESAKAFAKNTQNAESDIEKFSPQKNSDKETEAPSGESSAEKFSFHEKISKITGFKHTITKIKAEYKDEKNRLAFSHIWQEIIYLLKHIKPKYIHMDMIFSAGDPAITGQITGILSILPFMYKKDVHVYPDFMAEKVYIRGCFACKGHIRLWHICVAALRIIRDKNIKRLIHRIRNQEVTHE
ncbi:MAG: DUF2953 domain-containing protein [Lachnospiraceae bacterium]|nr:DUF2953 domain-containing protein [Lachnospiraceae bacterium]